MFPGVINSLISTIFSEIIPSNGAVILVFSISSSIFFKSDFTLAICDSMFESCDSNLISISF